MGASPSKVIDLKPVKNVELRKLKRALLRTSKIDGHKLCYVADKVKRNLDKVFKDARYASAMNGLCSVTYNHDAIMEFKGIRLHRRERALGAAVMSRFSKIFENLFNEFQRLYCDGKNLRAEKLRVNLHKFIDELCGMKTQRALINRGVDILDDSIF